jgi:hypothetical protein
MSGSSPGPVHYMNTRQTKGGKTQALEGTKARLKKSLGNKVNKTSDEDGEVVRLENEIDFCPVVRTMVMIAVLRDCCWTSLLWHGLGPVRVFPVRMLHYSHTVLEGGAGPSFTLPRSHRALVRLRFIAVSTNSAPNGARTAWWGQTACNGVTGCCDIITLPWSVIKTLPESRFSIERFS